LGCFFALDTSITFPRSLSSYLLHSFSLIQCGMWQSFLPVENVHTIRCWCAMYIHVHIYTACK
jgi:hypothetical protein